VAIACTQPGNILAFVPGCGNKTIELEIEIEIELEFEFKINQILYLYLTFSICF
jgi:hypothetical protein